MRLRPWLDLVRLPALFSAAGNPLAGYLLASGGREIEVGHAVAVSIAGVAIYAAGMVFNDVADAEKDRASGRPRPISRGRITRGAATGFGLALFWVGVFLASLASRECLVVAGGVVALVLAYDLALKRLGLVPGAIGMGLCRAGNLVMGSAVLGWPGAAEAAPVAALLGAYVVVLTLASHFEDHPAPRGGIVCAALAHAATIAGIALVPGSPLAWLPAVALAIWLATAYHGLDRRRDASLDRPAAAGRVVRTGVLGILLVDAAVIAGAGRIGLAWIPLALLVVGRGIAKWYAVSGGPED